jgi:hypothetical protein
MFHGPVPVKATDILGDPPAQIVCAPEITAVGKAFTVTIALPVCEVPVQLASLTEVKVYVLVLPGETEITLGLLVIPLIVTGVVPSV